MMTEEESDTPLSHDNMEEDATEDLQFQEMHSIDIHTSNPFEKQPESELPSWAEDTTSDTAQLLEENEESPRSETQQPPTSSSAPAIWTLEYYQQFFDIDTEQVLSRIKSSCWPIKNTFLKQIRQRGDLYGPFWISTTLVFVMAMAGNIANWKDATVDERDIWHYDFSKVTLAATAVYGYVTLIPLFLWLLLRWRTESEATLLEIFCVYGYSLFMYIPVSILCIFPMINSDTRWVFVMLAAALSVGVLLKNFDTCLQGQTKKARLTILSLIFACHIGLALGFKFYFFAYKQPKA